jgi:hypothetical protein
MNCARIGKPFGKALFFMFAAGTILSACGKDLDCEVAIIGGGVGGLHTAFRLGPTLGDRVCLFEKEEQLGGRIKDVSFDGSETSPRVGVGGRRVMETQQVLFDLAKELGLELQPQPGAIDLIEARSKFAWAKDDLRTQYPALVPDTDPNNDQETVIYDLLRKGPGRANAGNYGDFRSYIRGVAGPEGYEFLHDMSRFRADFEYPLDARGYLDYLDEEWDTCCAPSYPVGGMSEFVRRMEAKATESGVRIFKASPVVGISKVNDRYRVLAGAHTVKATKVIIGVSPYYLKSITGDVSTRLQAQRQMQELTEVRVATITQWWPTDWWTQIKNPGMATDNAVWRAWTTDHCVNFIEIPIEPYAAAQKVTRSVYDDDAACVQFWEDLAKKGTDAVEAEIDRGLKFLFNNNGVSMPATVTIPKPSKTYVQIWPDAWHWLRAGATSTNAEIFQWALEPLPGEAVYLVGEAYHPNRSGWSDAAYKSSINLLNKKFGLSLAGLSQPLRTSTLRPRGTHGLSR